MLQKIEAQIILVRWFTKVISPKPTVDKPSEQTLKEKNLF